jgi:hypothetical protein
MPREKHATHIRERIRRCKHCRTAMGASALSYDENPYCVNCLRERVRAATPAGTLSWRIRGHYIEFLTKGS